LPSIGDWPEAGSSCYNSFLMVQNNFVVLEGGDGTGTSTQLAILRRRLSEAGPRSGSEVCFEPTGGPIGALIRSALKGETPLRPDTVARLFAADRGEHLFGPGGVVERASAGVLVVSDRYVPSSLVYQGMTCGEELPAALNAPFPAPELLFYFEIDPETAMERIAGRESKDEFEVLEIQRVVKARYDRIIPAYCASGTRLVRVDATRSIDEVSDIVWSELRKLPIFSM